MARDPERIKKVLELLGEVWQKSPDLRLCQLIVNLVKSSEPSPAIFYYEDDKLIKSLEETLHANQTAK